MNCFLKRATGTLQYITLPIGLARFIAIKGLIAIEGSS
jgi:hypothetical protein